MPLDTMPSWVCVYVRGTEAEQVGVDHWDELDAAYHNWKERHIDRVLALVAITGADILVAASEIRFLYRSTPATRAKGNEFEALFKAERGFRDS